jgi:hypothetical protein
MFIARFIVWFMNVFIAWPSFKLIQRFHPEETEVIQAFEEAVGYGFKSDCHPVIYHEKYMRVKAMMEKAVQRAEKESKED